MQPLNFLALANALQNSLKQDDCGKGFVVHHLSNQTYAVAHEHRLIRMFDDLQAAEKFAQALVQFSNHS